MVSRIVQRKWNVLVSLASDFENMEAELLSLLRLISQRAREKEMIGHLEELGPLSMCEL